MNDFSFSGIFRAAFNTFIKNFTDILFLTILSTALILFISLFFNSAFLSCVDTIISIAMEGKMVEKTALNPFIVFSVYVALVFIFAALFVFCMASAMLPLCKGAGMKLKNYIPSVSAAVKFFISAVVVAAALETILIAVPLIAGRVSGGEGYTAGVLAISVISFALIAFIAVFALRYSLYFLPLLENAGLKEALKKSKALTKNRLTKLFVLFAVLFLINFVAKYFIFLLFLSVPFSILTIIYAYIELVPDVLAPEKYAAEAVQINQ